MMTTNPPLPRPPKSGPGLGAAPQAATGAPDADWGLDLQTPGGKTWREIGAEGASRAGQPDLAAVQAWEARVLNDQLDKLGVPDWNEQCKLSLWGRVKVALAGIPAAPGVNYYTLNQISQACMEAEISDGHAEALRIKLGSALAAAPPAPGKGSRAEDAPTTPAGMPELPQYTVRIGAPGKWGGGIRADLFTPDETQAYGLACYEAGRAAARDAALEDAALICDSVSTESNPMTARDCADALRALKGTP